MGVVSGLAVGLSRSAPPQSREIAAESLSPAEILTGYPLPPELEFSRWFTEWRMDWLWVAFAFLAGAAYLAGIMKLRKRGDKWSVLRSISWFAGLLALVYITSGGTAVYGAVMFSAHMVEHMALMVIAPLFLALGSPDLPGAAGADAAPGWLTRYPRMDLGAGALEVLQGHYAPAVCRGQLLRQPDPVLLLAGVQAGHDLPRGPRADDRALHAHGLHLCPEHDRRRPAAQARALPPAPAAAAWPPWPSTPSSVSRS